MLSDKRIKEAETSVRTYLAEGLLRKTSFNQKILLILKKNAQESLETANFLSNHSKSSMWIIVASYYSMFYQANALLYKTGYKVGDKIAHKVTADALIALLRRKIEKTLIQDYEDIRDEALAKIKSDELISFLDFERGKRSLVQYNTPEEIKISRVKTSLERAKEFVFQLEKLLGT